MDRQHCVQDVLRCHLCDTPHPSLHCDICAEYLCEACKGEHLSDLSKEHEVLPFRGRESTIKCPKHSSKICERYCIQCAIHVCVECASSKEHRRHEFLDKKDFLHRDLQELENQILSKYQEIAYKNSDQIAKLKKSYKDIKAAINNHGEELHREIDSVVKKFTSNLNEMESQCLDKLMSQENEITRKMSKITQMIAYLRKLLTLNDDSLVSAYKSRNAEYRTLPSTLIVSSPSFTPKKIKKEQIYQEFGFLSAFSIKKEEQKYQQFPIPTKEVNTMDSSDDHSSEVHRPLIAVSKVIAEINTDYALYKELRSVSCMSDEEIWTCGNNNQMKLYNLQGELIKSIQTKSGNFPNDITMTRKGDLIYSDYNDRTVNIVKKRHIETVIRLRGWMPTNVCLTSSDDLLIAMVSDRDKQTRVVRYSGSTEKQRIQYNDKEQPLYSPYGEKFIRENKNLDICVSDFYAKAVVVVNREGKLKFTYSGPPSTSKKSFKPYGIATDCWSRILIADSHTIHILDQGGQFLCFINNCHLDWPYGLCVDTNDNLYVAEYFEGKVKKIQYKT